MKRLQQPVQANMCYRLQLGPTRVAYHCDVPYRQTKKNENSQRNEQKRNRKASHIRARIRCGVRIFPHFHYETHSGAKSSSVCCHGQIFFCVSAALYTLFSHTHCTHIAIKREKCNVFCCSHARAPHFSAPVLSTHRNPLASHLIAIDGIALSLHVMYKSIAIS